VKFGAKYEYAFAELLSKDIYIAIPYLPIDENDKSNNNNSFY
jgi:hypothetical protein